MSDFLTFMFGAIVFGSIPILVSLEYYARKAKVIAAPSLPWMRVAVIRNIQTELPHLPPAPLILELGSGWGTLALDAARICPDARIIGYEMSPVPLLVSRLRAFVTQRRNVKFISADMYDQDFGKADMVLTYLTIPHMENLRPKFEAELKEGTVVISNTFPVPGWTPCREDTVQNLVYTLKVYTYRMGRR